LRGRDRVGDGVPLDLDADRIDEREAAEARRLAQRQLRRDPPAYRVADHGGVFQLERVE